MSLPIFQIDAFASRPFTGNPAAVCLLDGPRDDEWFQAVAAEMNLSETAFVAPPVDGVFGLRWCTPKAEVALCGHATLAAAHAMWESGRVPAGEAIRFATRSGELICRRKGDKIAMDFPATTFADIDTPPGLEAALGVSLRHVVRTEFDFLAELADEAAVRAVVPDYRLLAAIPIRGICITARSSAPRFDFVSRFFAPAVGIDEDPVTGSAHCALAPYWSVRLGKTRMAALQCSPRTGEVGVELRGDRVILTGSAVTVLVGELRV